jgi:cobalt-zinc-cadmium efflux system membrane fusion protein
MQSVPSPFSKLTSLGLQSCSDVQSEYQISVAETRAAADQLQLLGVTPAAIERLGKQGAVNSLTPVVATLNGVVVERKLAQGQVVQPADALFVVADLSNCGRLHRCLSSRSIRSRGQSVSIEVPALGNEKLWGKLIYVGQTINPETRTVLVRTELDNQ